MDIKDKKEAVLIIGPTGSGKTPLGDVCERKGAGGTECYHFDFGSILREIADNPLDQDYLIREDVEIIIHTLESGGLFENETFYIVRNILLAFMEKQVIADDNLLLLNGMPRHVGQARAVDEIVKIKGLIYLECEPDVVKERILCNSGGDRICREDDSIEAIEKKLELFNNRTMEILNYYGSKKVKIEKIPVSVETTPENILQTLNDRGFYDI
ncbi:MAG: nucleoside monophosphate kinase [Deltaproteobacteria bacterium]|nr:nucleoside monophosphate kinase [Deltaproteobacteria bacterium]